EFLIIINVNELLCNPLSGRVLLFTWVFYEPLVATGKGTDSLGEILPQHSFVSLWLLDLLRLSCSPAPVWAEIRLWRPHCETFAD
ncbi:hypothetical protein ACLKA6_012681, partial [Drosophila palustris]